MEEQKCVCMFRYTYAGIRIKNIQIEKDDRHMRRVMRIARVPPKICIKFAGKEGREQKGGYEYKTKHKPRSARNTGRNTGREEITGWVDSDFAADSDTRRSVTGYVMALNGAPISWRSCRQGGVTRSSSDAEYVAASAVAQENAYLCALLSGCDRSPLGPTCVWEDNAACILMSENPVNRDRSHHVDVKFQFLCERVRADEIKL